MEEKTNVMRLLDRAKVGYESHCYVDSGAVSATEVAAALGKDPKTVFKTLVCVAKSGAHYVFVLPSDDELDLKKAAAAVGEKSMSMLKSAELLPLTGYIHGGCSPIGMKKAFPTVLDESALAQQKICFSAGRIGWQVEMRPTDLAKLVRYKTAGITVT